MTAQAIDIVLEIEDGRWNQVLPNARTLLEQAIELALDDIDSKQRTIEIGIRLVDDATIQGLNRDWRGRDKPTNVLSFPLGDPGPAADMPWLLGDIVMAFETVTAEAVTSNKSLAHHVTHLAIHAALHLVGHDHETDAEAAKMEAQEVALLKRLDIPDPYRTAESSAGGEL